MRIVSLWAAGCCVAASGGLPSKRAKKSFNFPASEASLVLESLPHLPAVVAVQVIVDPPPVVRLGLSDAPLQIDMCCAVESLVTWSEGSVPLMSNLPSHPGLLVGVDPDAIVYCDNVYAVLNVTRNTVRKHIQVWTFENVPAGQISSSRGMLCEWRKSEEMLCLLQTPDFRRSCQL